MGGGARALVPAIRFDIIGPRLWVENAELGGMAVGGYDTGA